MHHSIGAPSVQAESLAGRRRLSHAEGLLVLPVSNVDGKHILAAVVLGVAYIAAGLPAGDQVGAGDAPALGAPVDRVSSCSIRCQAGVGIGTQRVVAKCPTPRIPSIRRHPRNTAQENTAKHHRAVVGQHLRPDQRHCYTHAAHAVFPLGNYYRHKLPNPRRFLYGIKSKSRRQALITCYRITPAAQCSDLPCLLSGWEQQRRKQGEANSNRQVDQHRHQGAARWGLCGLGDGMPERNRLPFLILFLRNAQDLSEVSFVREERDHFRRYSFRLPQAETGPAIRRP